MAIGRTLRESFFKALRSLEVKNPTRPTETDRRELAKKLSVPSDERIRYVVYALEQGWSVEEVSQLTSIDPWFLDQFQQFAELQGSIRATTLETIDAELLRKAKRDGFSDRRISFLLNTTPDKLRAKRISLGIKPVYKMVDTCAAARSTQIAGDGPTVRASATASSSAAVRSIPAECSVA